MGVVALAELMVRCAAWRAEGQRIVFTNGVFDLLHAGHVGYLERARTLGERLVVGVNSDESTRAIKGPLRPILPEADRALLLAALRPIDLVTIFREPTAEALVAALRPEIYVKGGDYGANDAQPDLDRLPEARLVIAYGGQVVLLPFTEGRSTSALIARILERYSS